MQIMKTFIKSITAIIASVVIISLSACSRQSGCGTWSQNEYKKQYHSQGVKDSKSYVPYRKYNS